MREARNAVGLDAGKVPGWVVSTLLLVCTFSPYGTFEAAGGTLRLDHLAVWVFAAVCLGAGWLARQPALVVGLLAFVGWTLLSTAIHFDLLEHGELAGMKMLDGFLRGPLVLWMVASTRPTEADRRRVIRTFVSIAILLACAAAAERVLPADSTPIAWLAERYGGPIPTSGLYAEVGMNHKQMCLELNRATAVFVTAPALAFAAVFFLVLSASSATGLGRLGRAVLFGCAVVAGLASNSKSFFVGLLVFLPLRAIDERRSRGLVLAALALGLLVLFLLVDRTSEQWTAFEYLRGAGAAEDPLDTLTAGRITRSGSLFDVGLRVLEDSPFVGYGLGQHPDLPYADNGLNTFLLGGGLLGLASALFGALAQFLWLFSRRRGSSWAALGGQTLVVGVAFLVAGALFQMPRIGDLFFGIVGLSVAGARAAAIALPAPGLVEVNDDGGDHVHGAVNVHVDVDVNVRPVFSKDSWYRR